MSRDSPLGSPAENEPPTVTATVQSPARAPEDEPPTITATATAPTIKGLAKSRAAEDADTVSAVDISPADAEPPTMNTVTAIVSPSVQPPTTEEAPATQAPSTEPAPTQKEPLTQAPSTQPSAVSAPATPDEDPPTQAMRAIRENDDPPTRPMGNEMRTAPVAFPIVPPEAIGERAVALVRGQAPVPLLIAPVITVKSEPRAAGEDVSDVSAAVRARRKGMIRIVIAAMAGLVAIITVGVVIKAAFGGSASESASTAKVTAEPSAPAQSVSTTAATAPTAPSDSALTATAAATTTTTTQEDSWGAIPALAASPAQPATGRPQPRATPPGAKAHPPPARPPRGSPAGKSSSRIVHAPPF